MTDITDFSYTRSPRARALIPFGVFLIFYLGLSIWSNDFYKVPMPVAFLVASATALLLNRKATLKSKIELFLAIDHWIAALAKFTRHVNPVFLSIKHYPSKSVHDLFKPIIGKSVIFKILPDLNHHVSFLYTNIIT